MEGIMEIKRDVYLNRFIVRKHNGFIKVITGIRRSGKSYLLNTLLYNHLIEEQKSQYLMLQMQNLYLRDIKNRYGFQDEVDVGVVESRERNEDGKEIRVQREIDFIATLGSKKYYVQSAYAIPDQAKYEQDTASFDKAMDSFKKIIIV